MKHIRLFSTVSERTSVVNDHPYDNILSYTKENNGLLISRSMPNDEIWYTTPNGNVITLLFTDVFGANIISNTYTNGKGVIKFDGPVTSVKFASYNEETEELDSPLISTIQLPNSVTTIDSFAFSGCTTLESIKIPNSVTTIGDYAFAVCESLTSIAIPNSVTSIRDYTFYGCGLTSVTIPDGVTIIGSSVFNECTSLVSVTIPDGVTSIGSYAFGSCTGLASIVCMPTTPPILSNTNSFYNTNNCPIYVPAASVDTYKAASRWSSLASRIQAIQS